MKIDVEDRGEVAVLIPENRLDLLGYLDLDEALGTLMREGRNRLILDLSNVGFMNSTSMAVIHRYSIQAKERRGGLILANVTDSVKGILSLGGLDELVDVCDTTDEAEGRLLASKKDETDKHKAGGSAPGPSDDDPEATETH